MKIQSHIEAHRYAFINAALKEQGEASIDGILGSDLLRAQNAIINYKNLTDFNGALFVTSNKNHRQ